MVLTKQFTEKSQKALIGGITQLPAANQHKASGFVETEFDKLIAVASAYGAPTVYCTYEFAAKNVT